MALISQSVGNNMTNIEEDVLNVKGALSEMDRFAEDEPHGYVTRELDDSIKSYQRDSGLKEDGILHPGGETETAIIEDMGRDAGDGTSPIPERGEHIEEINDAKCANLNIAYENALLELDRRQEVFEAAAEAYSEALSKFEQIKIEAGLQAGDGMRDIVSSVGTKPGPALAIGVGMGGAKIKGASQAYQSALNEFRDRLNAQEEAERLLNDSRTNVARIKNELSQSGCK